MTYPVYGRIDGPIVIIGFGSIGKGTLPLIERHFEFDATKLTVIEPEHDTHNFLAQRNIRHLELAITQDNYREVLGGLFAEGRGFCVNLSVDTSSLDLMRFCREIGVLYIDTVVEPWAGFYFETEDNEARTNYALRQAVRDEKARNPGGTTAVSCCGANPGMVSWFVKEALLRWPPTPGATRDARGPRGLGAADAVARRQGRPHRRTRHAGPPPAEAARHLRQHLVGRGLHRRRLPARGIGLGHARDLVPRRRPPSRARAAGGDLDRTPRRDHPGPHLVPDARPAVRVPRDPQRGDLDFGLLHRRRRPRARLPPDLPLRLPPLRRRGAVAARDVRLGATAAEAPHPHEDEIVEGIDELGVLLYGHARNALWYGSRLSTEEARELAPYQNATGLQVTSAVIAGMVWALENPQAGIVEADEMDHAAASRCSAPTSGRSRRTTPTGRR
jgi:homospermidine synthase